MPDNHPLQKKKKRINKIENSLLIHRDVFLPNTTLRNIFLSFNNSSDDWRHSRIRQQSVDKAPLIKPDHWQSTNALCSPWTRTTNERQLKFLFMDTLNYKRKKLPVAFRTK